MGLQLKVVRPVVRNHFWVTASFENLMEAKERIHICTHTDPQILHMVSGFLEPRKLIQELRIKNLWSRLVIRKKF